MSIADVVIDLGDLKLRADELLDMIEEEKQRLLRKYNIEDPHDIVKLYSMGVLTIDEILDFQHKLRILEEMENAIYEEIFIRKNKYGGVLFEKIKNLVKNIGSLR